jgi:hypothetical protein
MTAKIPLVATVISLLLVLRASVELRRKRKSLHKSHFSITYNIYSKPKTSKLSIKTSKSNKLNSDPPFKNLN